MSKIFNQVTMDRPQESTFDLSHEVKLSLDMGKLIPIGCFETLPKDVWRMDTEIFLRLMPTLAPIMHRVDVFTHAFFVPNRLVYDDWQEFITGGDTGESTAVFPYIDLNYVDPTLVGKGSMLDYMGIPLPSGSNYADDTRISAIPFRAYQTIYNEFYRDQNLQEEVVVLKTGGLETEQDGLLTLRRRSWEKDYFTSCLPLPQKGESVLLPLQGSVTATLSGNGLVTHTTTGNHRQLFVDTNGNALDAVAPYDVMGYAKFDPTQDNVKFGAFSVGTNDGLGNNGSDLPANIDPNGSLQVDLSTGTANLDMSSIKGSTSINDLREAFQVQKFLEKLMRGGSRYAEVIESFFGVRTQDFRLQRPEYIGGGQQHIQLSEVPQTSETTENSVQGTLAGKGISVGKTQDVNYFCHEHGHIIVLMSVLPRTSYQQGLHKMWNRFDRLDYAWPTFAHLGEQEVLTRELFFDTSIKESEGTNISTFGYQSRYAEYKYFGSRVCADMRDNLSFWHMGRILENPADAKLNSEFIECHPTTRIFPVTGIDDSNTNEDGDGLDIRPVFGSVYHNIECKRPLPFIGDPGYIDHF